jgi:DNA-binding LacI/PurR family transcriptional regulator
VPDVAVVGFDDIRDAADHHPSLTTVRQPVAQLGAEMTRLLFDRIDGTSAEPVGVKLPVELVLRESA